MSDRKLAVMLVHGVESAGEQYAARATDLLRSEFTRIAGVSADEALVIEPAFWAPVFESGQEQLSERLSGPGAKWLLNMLDALAARASQGSTPALLAAASTAGLRWLPGLEDAHFPTLRWLIVHYLGDAVGLPARAPTARGTTSRSRPCWPAACTSSPSRPATTPRWRCSGTASAASSPATSSTTCRAWRTGPRSTPAPEAALDDTPIERGETFGWFYTLGSPLALWAQRHPDFGVPLTVPHPEFAEHHPDQRGEWVNVYDPDDVIASPLRPLSDAWAGAVREDRRVGVGPWWLGWTPLAHPYYWNDRRVVTPIASPARPGLAPPLSCALARARVHRTPASTRARHTVGPGEFVARTHCR